jgi:hypothetical protein
METSQQILVIILSTALAVLLVLCIAIAIMAIKLLQAVKRVADKAEHIVESAEHVSEAFSRATGSAALFKVIGNIVSLVSKTSKKRK